MKAEHALFTFGLVVWLLSVAVGLLGGFLVILPLLWWMRHWP